MLALEEVFLRRPAVGAVILAACLLILPGCARSQQAASSRAEQARPAVSVAVQKVGRATIEREVVAGGPLMGIRKAVVGPKTAGRVAQVRVTVGQAVKAGDILFELDKTDVETQLRQARADLVAAQENKKLADINRENARQQWERYKELFEAGAVSRDTYEQYLLKYQQASVGTAEAQLERAQAQVAALETQLENMTVRAPLRRAGEQGGRKPGRNGLQFQSMCGNSGFEPGEGNDKRGRGRGK